MHSMPSEKRGEQIRESNWDRDHRKQADEKRRSRRTFLSSRSPSRRRLGRDDQRHNRDKIAQSENTRRQDMLIPPGNGAIRSQSAHCRSSSVSPATGVKKTKKSPRSPPRLIDIGSKGTEDSDRERRGKAQRRYSCDGDFESPSAEFRESRVTVRSRRSRQARRRRSNDDDYEGSRSVRNTKKAQDVPFHRGTLSLSPSVKARKQLRSIKARIDALDVDDHARSRDCSPAPTKGYQSADDVPIRPRRKRSVERLKSGAKKLGTSLRNLYSDRSQSPHSTDEGRSRPTLDRRSSSWKKIGGSFRNLYGRRHRSEGLGDMDDGRKWEDSDRPTANDGSLRSLADSPNNNSNVFDRDMPLDLSSIDGAMEASLGDITPERSLKPRDGGAALTESQRSKLRSLLDRSSSDNLSYYGGESVTESLTASDWGSQGHHSSYSASGRQTGRQRMSFNAGEETFVLRKSNSLRKLQDQKQHEAAGHRRVRSFEDLTDVVDLDDHIYETMDIKPSPGQLMEDFCSPDDRRRRSHENALASLSNADIKQIHAESVEEPRSESEPSTRITDEIRTSMRRKLAMARTEMRRKRFGFGILSLPATNSTAGDESDNEDDIVLVLDQDEDDDNDDDDQVEDLDNETSENKQKRAMRRKLFGYESFRLPRVESLEEDSGKEEDLDQAARDMCAMLIGFGNDGGSNSFSIENSNS